MKIHRMSRASVVTMGRLIILSVGLTALGGCSITGYPAIGFSGHAGGWEWPADRVIYDEVYEDYYTHLGSWSKNIKDAQRFTKKDAIAFITKHRVEEEGEYSDPGSNAKYPIKMRWAP